MLNPYQIALIHAGDCNEFRLARLIEWAGLEKDKFDYLDITESSLFSRNRVLVPMGNVATGILTGRQGILSIRGYVSPGPGSTHVIPTVSTSFIQRGQSRWSAAFINDIQKAHELSREGLPPQVVSYTIDPSPLGALNWAKSYREYLIKAPHTRLAFDIETPGKGEDEDDVDTDSDAPDRTWNIDRIGFSYAGLSALSIPWEHSYFAAIRLLLESGGEKIVWNAGFDVPRIRRAGVAIHGLIHDAMVAWHILHTDLPKSLKFVATFVCPWQPAWKHLSGSHPGFYNATDADVEWRAMERIEFELKRTGIWDVYQRDVVDLEPILVHMQKMGMPVDQDIRLDRALKLSQKLSLAHSTMTSCIPLDARKIEKIFVQSPKPDKRKGLLTRPGHREVNVCSICGIERPTKPHFKRYVKKQNRCVEGCIIQRTVAVEEYYRLADFTPSRDQLIRYHQHLKRPLPMTWDKKAGKKKVSFGEKQIKELIIKYPTDSLYPSILDYRAIDKLAGTYVGRVSE